jgi:Sugar (and other) transporter.
MWIGCFTRDKNNAKQPNRAILINFLMFACFFSFYYALVYRILPEAGFDSSLTTILQAAFLFTVVITILIVSHLSDNLGKKHITIFSLTTIASLPFLIFTATFPYELFFIVLIGIFFGIAQLSAFTLFWKTTESLKRSRIAGIIGFAALICYFIMYFLSSDIVGYMGNIALCMLLFASTAIGSVFAVERDVDSRLGKAMYFPERRTIILYAAPWVLFSFLNITLTKNITGITSAISTSSLYLVFFSSQIIGGICGALIGGYFADRVGRRLTLVSSVALYGVSMAFRGFIDNPGALLFSFIGEGLTWGIFLILYSFVIWGDLANTKNITKTYAVGLIAFYATAGIGVFNLFGDISVVDSTLISCILIFSAIVPIVFAPELLTSEAQERNKLKKYIETVRKVADESE